jgi:hypothetical protein
LGLACFCFSKSLKEGTRKKEEGRWGDALVEEKSGLSSVLHQYPAAPLQSLVLRVFFFLFSPHFY